MEADGETFTTGCVPHDVDGNLPPSDPDLTSWSPLMHHIMTTKLAHLSFHFFKMRKDVSIQHITKAMDVFDDFHSQLPEYFKTQHPGIRELYQYKNSHERRIGWQGFCISIGIDYIRLYAARAAIRYITEGNTTEAVRDLHQRGTIAATNVIQRVADPNVPCIFRKLW